MCSKFIKKELILSLLMFVFKRGMVFLSKNDTEFIKLIEDLPERFSFLMTVRNTNLRVSMKKSNGVLIYAKNQKEFDLILEFSNLCSAFLVFAGFMPQYQAFSEHRLSIKGNISDALCLTDAINRLQAVIFPDIISKKLIKEFEGSSLKEKSLFAKFYLYALLLLR